MLLLGRLRRVKQFGVAHGGPDRIGGDVDDGFGRVADEFARNFRERR